MSKALALDTPLPTPDGWSTMGEVSPGDWLFDERGQPCRVVGISPVMPDKACYRVSFCDGSSLIASDDHLWTVEKFSKHRGALDRKTMTLSTLDMLEAGVVRNNGAAKFSIRVADALALSDAELPLSPYILGVWLGDGNSRAPAITVGTKDLDVMSRLIEAEGIEISARPDKDCWRVAMRGNGFNVRTRLREMGLIQNKHIPTAYLRASAAQRLALLQGLMDTDGTVLSGAGSFCSKHEALARQVLELAASLGFRPRLSRHVAPDGYVSWQCRFHAYRENQIFRFARKQEKLKSIHGDKVRPWENNRRYIQSIEPVETVPVRCIAVDSPSHLFLAGERMVPTHNTDGILDAMGWRLATKPRPQLYVGPSREFVADQFEPRLMKLFDEAPRLAELVDRGKKNKKTRKMVAGVPVRLAWAGSETSLSSDQAGDVYIDEFDKMVGFRKGTGDPLGLAKARADTYRDRKIVVTSTPKRGLVEIEHCPMTGLEFWKVADSQNIQSPIWQLWQQGTRHHWSWRCPHCGGWFIPRMSLLRYPEKATPSIARRETYLQCPAGCVVDEAEKSGMNAEGRFIAPGTLIDPDTGDVLDEEGIDNSVLSLWASGVASPFLDWGERVEEILRAESTGDAETRQAARNKTGELWAPVGGDVPEWEEILNRREEYVGVPPGVVFLTAGIDVQKNRLVYVIRGWGGRATSWKITSGELWGPTELPQVWHDLQMLLSRPIAGLPIRLAFIDSGFRPGKKINFPLNRIYAFAKRNERFVFATKGSSSAMIKPLLKSKAEVNRRGEVDKYGLELIRLDPDYWKSWVHERLDWPLDQPGAWHIRSEGKGATGQKNDEDYARQIVAEARIVDEAGKGVWIERSAENHYLDCEALCAAAAFMLNAHNLPVNSRRKMIEAGQSPPIVPVADALEEERELETVAERAPIAVLTEKPRAASVVSKPATPRFNKFSQLAARLNR